MSGDTIWAGNMLIGFDYADTHGVLSSRNIILKRYFNRSTGNYFAGHCHLRNEARSFKTSRIVGNISIEGKLIAKQRFLSGLKANNIPILLTERPVQKAAIENNKVSVSGRKKPVKRKNNDAIKWREEGLLSIRGYRVGKTKGLPEHERRSILKNLFLRDQLSDVTDRTYASEWGEPGSRTRQNKLKTTLKSLADMADKRTGKSRKSLNQAIKEWRSDIFYLDNLV